MLSTLEQIKEVETEYMMYECSWKRTSKLLFAFAIVLIIGGCSNSSEQGLDTLSGYFIDSPVAGLQYSSDSVSGVTSKDGNFQYIEGEIIRFHLEDLTLGYSQGKTIITPLDLVSADMAFLDNTQVTNILRILQTFDSNKSDDTIEIDAQTRIIFTEITADLTAPLSDKRNSNWLASSLSLFSKLTSINTLLVSERQAVEKFRNYIEQLNSTSTGTKINLDTDLDRDGLGDNIDDDDDGDNVADADDDFPLDKNESVDTDSDGLGDNIDDDDDGDNVADADDDFPLNKDKFKYLVRAYNVANEENRINIFISMGQSNSAGISAEEDIATPNIFMPMEHTHEYPNHLTLQKVSSHNINKANFVNRPQINTATKFAQEYYSTTPLIIVNIARGGVGILSGFGSIFDHWNIARPDIDSLSLHPQTINYLEVLFNQLQSEGSEPYVIGVDWNQWEAEDPGRSAQDYLDTYSEFFESLVTVMPNKDYRLFICNPSSSYFAHANKISEAFELLAHNRSNTIVYKPNELSIEVFRDDIEVHYTEYTHEQIAAFILSEIDSYTP